MNKESNDIIHKLQQHAKINPHQLSVSMKEMVRRVIEKIKEERFIFTATAKTVDYKSDPNDIVTSADHAAQGIYLKMIREEFPHAGIIAEEDFARDCTSRSRKKYFFTIDPLDGTKAFKRRQSEGISTMLAFAFDGEVIATCIGDIMTGEIYSWRAGSDKVHRISDLKTPEDLSIDPKLLLKEQYILLRDDPRDYSHFVQKITHGKDKWCTSIEVSSGSIGLSFAKLWKGQMGGIILRPGHDTPWDTAPLLGISKQMGFIYYKIADSKLTLIPFPKFSRTIVERDYELLVVHRSREQEIESRQR